MKRYAKFGYAAPLRFRVILEKPQGGQNDPPTRAKVNHLLLECQHFDLHRRHIAAYCRQENVPLNIEQLLGDKQPELLTLLFQYLRETKLAGAL